MFSCDVTLEIRALLQRLQAELLGQRDFSLAAGVMADSTSARPLGSYG